MGPYSAARPQYLFLPELPPGSIDRPMGELWMNQQNELKRLLGLKISAHFGFRMHVVHLFTQCVRSLNHQTRAQLFFCWQSLLTMLLTYLRIFWAQYLAVCLYQRTNIPM